MGRKRRKLTPRNVKEMNNGLINSMLLDEIFIKIFGYLTHNELGRIARVCRKWNKLTRTPVLWKKVLVHINEHHVSKNSVVLSLVANLPSCVNYFYLDFGRYQGTEELNFEKLCMRLEKKCPDLETLFLRYAELTVSIKSAVDLCTLFLPNVKVLALPHVNFELDEKCPATKECTAISKIEVLDIRHCWDLKKPPFSRMPHLKKLNIAFSYATDSWFQASKSFFNRLEVVNVGGFTAYLGSRTFQEILKNGLNLKELYMCGPAKRIGDSLLNFDRSSCPQLKIVCLRYCDSITWKGVVSLIQSCPSLQYVYVDGETYQLYEAHSHLAANRCALEAVQVVSDHPIHHLGY